MKILIFGGYGQIGQALYKECIYQKKDYIIKRVSRKECPIENHKKINTLISEFLPDIVINLTAFHNLEKCELDPKTAFNINAYSVQNLATCCSYHNSYFLTISTNYVFNGQTDKPYYEDDQTGPLQIYALSKLLGEELLLLINNLKYTIIRTSGVFSNIEVGQKGLGFFDRI